MTRLLVSFVLVLGWVAAQQKSLQQKTADADAFPRSRVPLAAGLEYADNLTLRSPRNFLNDVPARAGEGLVNAVVEIPSGYCEKWEVKSDGVMRWDMKNGKPRNVKYLGYPCNYGMVPGTCLGREIGGDGDPLDVVVLGPALPRGSVVAVRLLGLIRLVDGGEKDDKLIAVLPDSPLAEARSVSELDRLYPGITAILRTWFESYKGKGEMSCSGFADGEEAERLLAAGCASYAAADAGR